MALCVFVPMDTKFQQVKEVKYLGVMLDNRLRFDAQAEYAASKARKAFVQINRLITGNRRQGLTVQNGAGIVQKSGQTASGICTSCLGHYA